MKKHPILLALLLVAGVQAGASAQASSDQITTGHTASLSTLKTVDNNGVYLSADDFVHGKLTDAFAQNTSGEHLWTDVPTSAVRVVTPLVTEKFPASKTWGFRKQGIDYRIVDGLTFEIVNRDDILMYRIVNPDPNRFTYNALYYFSRYADSDLFPINKRNLEMVYSDHPAFVHALKTTSQLLYKNDNESIGGGLALYLLRQGDLSAHATIADPSVSPIN